MRAIALSGRSSNSGRLSKKNSAGILGFSIISLSGFQLYHICSNGSASGLLFKDKKSPYVDDVRRLHRKSFPKTAQQA